MQERMTQIVATQAGTGLAPIDGEIKETLRGLSLSA